MGAAADPGFARGQTMVRAQSTSLNRRLGAESPAGSMGKAPGGGLGRKAP